MGFSADSFDRRMSVWFRTRSWGRGWGSPLAPLTVLVASLVTALAASTSPALASSHQWYRGHVHLGGGQSAQIHLRVKPGAGGYVDRTGSDKIPLHCDQGSMGVRIHP